MAFTPDDEPTPGGDDHLNRALAELGEPDLLFQVSRARYRTKLGAGVGLIVGGAALNLLWLVLGAAGAFLAKFLLAPPILGVFILLHMYRQRGLFVLLYPTGLLRLRRGEVESFPWPEIAEVRLKLQRAGAPETRSDDDGNPTACWFTTDVPSVQLWKVGLVVQRTDGTEASFGAALADYPLLTEEVQRRTFARLWPAARDRLLAGEAVEFGDLEVTPTGLRHLKKFLAWRDFNEMLVAQGRLTVKQAGKWLPWGVYDVSKVPNPHVLFALVAEARRHRLTRQRQPQEDQEG